MILSKTLFNHLNALQSIENLVDIDMDYFFDIEDPQKQDKDVHTPEKKNMQITLMEQEKQKKHFYEQTSQMYKRPKKCQLPANYCFSLLDDNQIYFPSHKLFIIKSPQREFEYQKTQHVRLNRARILDWFLQVCMCFRLSWRTFWTARDILDVLIVDLKIISKQNIHIYGTTALWMASKYHQTKPLIMIEIIKKVVFNKFKRSEILEKQNQILRMFNFTHKDKLKYSTGLFSSNVYDRLFQIFPQIPECLAKKAFGQLVYIYMDPKIALNSLEIMKNQTILIEKVLNCVFQGKHLELSQCVKNIYYKDYKCIGVQMYGEIISL